MKISKRTKLRIYRVYKHVLGVSLISLWSLSLNTLAIALYTIILFPLLWMTIPDLREERNVIPLEMQDEEAKIDDDCLITLREYHL